MKRALVIRLGAYGDMIQATCVFPYFTKAGYKLTVNCDERALPIIENNPHVSDVILYKRDSVPIQRLQEYWKELGKDFDKWVSLSGSVVESYLLWGFRDYMYWAKDAWRRKVADNKNYMEFYIKECGFMPCPPCRGELYFTHEERDWAKRLIKGRFEKNYVLLYAYAGSALHKAYAHYGEFLLTLLAEWPDLMVITVGGEECEWLDMEHPRIMNTSGLWSIRQSLAVVPYVDLVVGPETGILNAAGCFETPKVCLLSHSSKDNLTKHWANDYSLQMECLCSPCHKLIRYNDDMNECLRGPLGYVACAESLPTLTLVNHVKKLREETYGKIERGNPRVEKTAAAV